MPHNQVTTDITEMPSKMCLASDGLSSSFYFRVYFLLFMINKPIRELQKRVAKFGYLWSLTELDMNIIDVFHPVLIFFLINNFLYNLHIFFSIYLKNAQLVGCNWLHFKRLYL